MVADTDAVKSATDNTNAKTALHVKFVLFSNAKYQSISDKPEITHVVWLLSTT